MGKAQVRGHAETSEAGRDDGVGCVGQVICIYPHVPRFADVPSKFRDLLTRLFNSSR